ncbi:unnamed protein product [Parnassius apollo]|uniref:(apollo) hypothetical protein n=1 Tax=Parnassius apollo TaxID=110799 RepID=A0A8S3XUR6_PARAO|nr:unnamed protein product [Parnassius apollo]
MRCCSSGLSNACGVLHQWRVPIAEPAKTLPTPSQLVGMMDARSCWVVVQHLALGWRFACCRVQRQLQTRPGDRQAAALCAFHLIPASILGRHLAGDAQTRRRFMVRPCAQAGLGTFNFCRGTALTPLGKVLTDCAE